MKNTLLLSLIMLGASGAYGITTEKNGISVTYEHCLYYNSMVFGMPYCLTIKNETYHAITVGPELVSISIVPYKKVVDNIKLTYSIGTGFTGLLSTLVGLLAYANFRPSDVDEVFLKDPASMAQMATGKYKIFSNQKVISKVSMTASIAAAFLTAYLLYKRILINDIEKAVEKEAFHEPFTIQPGQTIRKLFWLKNHQDPIRINFDSIIIY